MNNSESLTTEVLIVGAGPAGLTLANLLGTYGVRTLVIERHDSTVREPRAVTIDDESLRTMQAAGMVDDVVRDVVLGYGVQYYSWRSKPFAAIQPTRQEYGYPKRNAFRQPTLEATLLSGLKRFADTTILFRHQLLSFSDDGNRVQAQVRTETGERTITAKWLIACDGASSTVRDLCGIKLQGTTYPERWLIVDMAERKVALRHTSTFCDPRRPCIRLPGPKGTVRYEFMLRPSDRDEDMLNEANFRRWIGEREPLDRDLPLVRKAIYTFHARVAAQWKKGRVLLAGDAAHLTPPFAGQGLNSGIRDVTNLAWKLAAVTKWGAPDSLLDSYEPERRPHASALIQMALRIGHFMQPKSVLSAFLSQSALRIACMIPAIRNYVLQLRFKPKPVLQSGLFVSDDQHPMSELFPQPLVETGKRTKKLLDDVLDNGFAVLGWSCDALIDHGARLLPPGVPGKVVTLLRSKDDFIQPAGSNVELVRDITGELANWLDRAGAVAVVLRPDHYWFRLVTASELAGLATEPVSPLLRAWGMSSHAVNATSQRESTSLST